MNNVTRPSRHRRVPSIRWIAIVMVLSLVGAGVHGDSRRPRGPVEELVTGSSAPAQPPTFESADHDVQLRVPDGAMEAGTQVRFVPLGQDVTDDLNSSARGVTAAGNPVDVAVVAGALAPNRVKVTLRYDPNLIPVGLTDKQVGMSMFDEGLGSWIPLLDAKADRDSRTVTATAPHFSRIVSTVLNAVKSVVDIGGKVIHTVIDATVTPSQWMAKLSSEILVILVKDLLGVPEELKCKSLSPDVDVRPKSLLELLRACAEPSTGGDVTVRLRNGFAFPLRTAPLPAGIVLRQSDVFNDGADLPNLVRNLFWSFRGQTVLAGTVTGSVTAAPELDGAQTVKMDIDSEAISFDMVLAVLTSFAPATAPAKDAVKVAVQALLKGAIKAEALTGWLKHAYDGLDCVINAAHHAVDLFGQESVKAQAQIAVGCLEMVLSAAGVKGAVGDLIANVKVFPELVEVVLYPVAGQLGEQLGLYRQEPPSVVAERDGATVVRFDGVGESTLRLTTKDLLARGYTNKGNQHEGANASCVRYAKDQEPLDFSVESATGRVLAISLSAADRSPRTEIGAIHAGSTLGDLRKAFAGHRIEEHLAQDFGQGTNGVVIHGDGGSIAFSLDDATASAYTSGTAQVIHINGVGLPGFAPTNAENGC